MRQLSKRFEFWVQIGLAFAALAGGIYVSITPANSLVRWYNIDDAFYYYKVAQNVLTGHGFTFDQINLTNGFHPLWMIICLGVFWLSSVNILLPLRVLVIVSALFNAGTGVLLFRLLKKYLHPGAAIIGSALWVLLPAIYNTVTAHGIEAAASAFFIVLLLLVSTNFLNSPDGEKSRDIRQLLLIGFIGGVTILARLDNIFIVAIIGLFLLFKVRRIPSLALYDIIAISFAVFAAWIARLGVTVFEINSYSIYPMLAASIVIKPIVFYFSGLYSQHSSGAGFKTLFRVGIATIISFVLEYALLSLFFKLNITKMFSKSVVGYDAAISFVMVALIHFLAVKAGQSQQEKPTVLFFRWIREMWKTVLLRAVSFAAPIGVILGIYVTLNKIMFGTFSPVSGQIKHWWSTFPNTVYSHENTLISVLGLSPSSNFGPWSLFTSWLFNTAARITDLLRWKDGQRETLVFGFLIIISFFIFLFVMHAKNGQLARKSFVLLIPAVLVGCMIQIAYYTASGYQHTRNWYWVAEMLTLVLIGTVILDGLFTWFERPGRKEKISILFTSILVISLFTLHISYILRLAPYRVPVENQADYLAEATEVEYYTDEGTLIGMTGGGLVAYFIENRTIVNLDGLINSTEYFEAMKTGTARDFLDKLPLNYVYGKPYVLQVSDPYNEIFKNRLVEIGFIRGFENFTLFKYQVNQ